MLRKRFNATESEIGMLNRVFDFFDLDGEGTMTIDELEHVLNFIDRGVTTADLNSILKTLDANDDGIVNRSEFLTMCLVLQGRKAEQVEEDVKTSGGLVGRLLGKIGSRLFSPKKDEESDGA